MKKQYAWQGEQVKVEFGHCLVKTRKDKPMWWWNFECYPDGIGCIEAIKVTAKSGDTFIISNHFGIGAHKLKNGGWPNYIHFSLEGNFMPGAPIGLKKLDLEGFEEHERKRREWQKIHYPVEFKESEKIREMIKGFAL